MILIIIAIILFVLSIITDVINTHYRNKGNKLMEEQNNTLLEIMKLDNEIMMKMAKKENGGNTHE